MKTPIGKLGSYSLHRNGPRDDAVGATADFCTQNFGQTNPSSGRESHRTQESANSARDLAERIGRGEKVYVLDVRTREEYDAVKIDKAHLFTQELMQEIQSSWPRENLFIIYDHQGTRSLDAAAYFQGHGFENVKSLRGGIDAWSVDVDPKLSRYHLEQA